MLRGPPNICRSSKRDLSQVKSAETAAVNGVASARTVRPCDNFLRRLRDVSRDCSVASTKGTAARPLQDTRGKAARARMYHSAAKARDDERAIDLVGVLRPEENRGGIEPSPIRLKIRYFLNSGFPVYLPVDPTLSPRREGATMCAAAEVVWGHRHTKHIISAVLRGTRSVS